MTNIVVAKHNEDVSWVHKYDDYTIIQKGAQLPNRGREPSSYLWFIITNYDDLEDDYIFTQGNPHDHCLFEREAKEGKGKDFYWFKTNGRTGLVCDMDGKPHDNVQVGKFLELIGIDYKRDNIIFNGCCIFLVSANRIKQRPKEFYENIYNILLDTSNSMYRYEYAFERCVGLIFGE